MTLALRTSNKRAYSGDYPIQAYNNRQVGTISKRRKFLQQVYVPRPMVSSGRRYGGGRSSTYRMLGGSNVRHQNPVYPRPEAKYIDINQNGDPFSATQAALPIPFGGKTTGLIPIVQGVDAQARIGLTISVKSVAYRFEVDMVSPLPSPAVPNNGRVILIWDRQPNGTNAPPVNTFLEANSYLSYILMTQKERFVFLRNDMFSISPNGNTTMFFEGYVKINMNTTYNGGGNTVASGNLVLLFIGDQTANQPTINGCWRIRYYDT